MKLQIDTTLKTVTFMEPVDFETMELELPKLLGEDWKKWKIELNYYPTLPFYPVYPTYPTMPEPPYYWNPVTCDTNSSGK